MNCVLTMLVRTGCFDWHEFPGASESENEQVDLFIREVITASAAFGVSQEDNAYYEYSKAVMQKSMGRTKYCAYMIKWAFRNTLSQMWPEKEQLLALYNADKKKKVWIPWLRFKRVFELPIQKMKAGITPKRLLLNQDASNVSAAERMQVFEQLNML